MVRFLNCLKRNFAVNQNLNYGTLLKIMVEIYYNINRVQTVFYTLHTIGDSRHKSFLMGNAALCHSSDKVKVITQSLYTTTDDGVFSLDEVDGE